MTNNKRKAWYHANLWLGADGVALYRLLSENRWKVDPGHYLDCLSDLTFSMLNLLLRKVREKLYSRRLLNQDIDKAPLFIIGHWRTGTTLMHQLLALDERHSYPSTYQCFAPGHFLLSEPWLKRWTHFLLPATRPMDTMEMDWDHPQEDEFALCNMGLPSPYANIAFPNQPMQNNAYYELEEIEDQKLRAWQQGLEDFIRQILYRSPGRIILKSPTHTFRIPLLLKMFPDARFVYMARNPHDTIVSTRRLWRALYLNYGYQCPKFIGLDEQIVELFVRMENRYNQTRSMIAADRLIEIRYEDLIVNMPGQLREVYDRLDLGTFAPLKEALARYMAEHTNYQANRHETDDGLNRILYHHCRSYFDRFDYPAE